MIIGYKVLLTEWCEELKIKTSKLLERKQTPSGISTIPLLLASRTNISMAPKQLLVK